MQQTFAEFLVEGAGVGKPLELLVQWLARGSEDDGQKCDNTNQWRSLLIRFLRPDEAIPEDIDRLMYRDCLALYREHCTEAEKPANLFSNRS